MKTQRNFALLRIAFGAVWAVDAFLKWQPVFLNNFVSEVSAMASGQPWWVNAWIGWWVAFVSPHPHMFAIIVALLQSAIALGLIFGILTRVTLAGGIIFSLVIWSVPEAFGGPYGPGSTDVGAALVYVLVFAALWVGTSWRMYSVDSFLNKTWPNFFLWRDVETHTVTTENKKDIVTESLLLLVLILGSVIFVTFFPSGQTMGPGAMTPAGMMLKTYEVPAGYRTPTVDFTITKDPTSMGGWDVHITTTNFTFTPQNVNSAPVPDQGHVHLYVDNTLYVVYGPWYHLDDLSAGTHVITVALAQNDHSIYTKNGQDIQIQKTITQ